MLFLHSCFPVKAPWPITNLVYGICGMQGSSSSSSSSNSHAGHAFLHDFCMTIPYGGIAALSGLLAFAFKAPAVGLQLAAVAAVVALCSILSLKSWKAGGSSTAYTLVSAGTFPMRTHSDQALAQLLFLAAAVVGHQHTHNIKLYISGELVMRSTAPSVAALLLWCMCLWLGRVQHVGGRGCWCCAGAVWHLAGSVSSTVCVLRVQCTGWRQPPASKESGLSCAT
jgi:hypothetical protein